ncbi:hypothetical protein Tco_0877433 [Tanacetum coccineum]|uniref:Uncharacterized protein n=1 Tax=Tanacetum coccineum TaxID=301880 RepID=A0ABQ5BXN2_9ASTR
MSDSDESGVTYTEVSSPFEDLSDIGSPRADDHEYLELPKMPEDPYVEAALQAPPSPDYVPGPEEPEQAPPSPDYVPGPEHADDEIVAEDQPYAEDASPTAQSPDYVPESDPEADPEEDDDEDPEEDPADDDEEEEEEHLAPVDSVVVALPVTDQALSADMSDLDESGVTYTEVSSLFKSLSDLGSPRADDHEYLDLPWMPEDPYMEAALQAPPSPDYVPGLEEPEQAPPSLDYVPGPEHADDEIIAEDQPYAEDASPNTQSPDYVPESDPEADPEEDDDEDPEEDPVDYPANRGDNIDDEDEPSKEDEDDDVNIEVDEDEEEVHLALADSVVVALPTMDQAPSTEETEPFETDDSAATPPPHPAYRVTARISIPPLLLPSASRREDRPEVTLPPRKRLGIALGPRYEVGESSSAAAARPAGGLRADYGFVATMDREIRRDPERDVGYGITDSWDEIVETLQGAPVSTDTELGRHMTAFETRVRQDTDEIYTRLDDEQSQRQLLAGRLNMLFRDRRAHAYTRHLMETEARLSREAWRRSMDASDLAHGEVMSLRTTVLGQMSEIRELHAADRRRQAVTSEMLKADHRRSAEMRELRTADRTRQQQLIQTLIVMQSLQG